MDLFKRLTGSESEHLEKYKDNENLLGLAVALEDFYFIKEKAKKQKDIDLKIISAFRDFERQKMIWNKKARGETTLLDQEGRPLPFENLSEKDIVFSILRWSAFPGTSRHHWGTDFDIIDQKALDRNPDYKIHLIPSEYKKEGIFENLGQWLENEFRDLNIFFHPYDKDLGGVSVEPWHISHIASSGEFEKEFSFDFFNELLNSLNGDDVALLHIVKEHAEEIYSRFITNTTRPS